MWLVVGLGNPGPEYAETRHNAGFMVIDTLAKRWGIALAVDADGRARRGRGTHGGHAVQLVEPLVYMNRSGEVLDPVAADDHVVAVYDDLDLPAGRLRIRPRGGTGGHNGVASLVERLGNEFCRLRVGIGRPPEGVDAATYVLSPLSTDDAQALHATAERACDAIEMMITDGTASAMSRFNGAAATSADPN